MNLVYLAAPYSHTDPDVVEARMSRLYAVDAHLTKRGAMTVSPLYKHALLQHSDLPGDWEYWKTYAEVLLSKCDAMIVVTMLGWDESIGVQAEIQLCKQLGIPVAYVDPFTLEVIDI